MTPDIGTQPIDVDGAGELSPVKRALLEVRRLRAELDAARRDRSEPIVIVGMAVRLPGSIASPEGLWQALLEGRDLISDVPADRWQASLYQSPNTDQLGTMGSAQGGFVSNVDCFDAEFFGVAPREAASMDPQHRILLELAWEALERAGIDPQSLFDTQAGVFLGLSNSDYSRLLVEHGETIDGYTGVGAAISMAAGRLAYFFGCHGPAMVIDTACSSSLVAIHHAVSSLRRGEASLALVGGANLILTPEMNLSFSRTGMLSAEGRCKVFSDLADGYVRSEGCCVMVLKRLGDAKRDGDKVLAVVHGSAVNQDGRSAGITAPNGPAQAAVMRAALKDAGVDPVAVTYVEAHGTGTPLGDPMELQALASVYGPGRVAGDRLKVGSIKSNLGHTEAAAGLVSLAKVVLMMQPGNGFVPGLHPAELNRRLDWTTLPLEIVTSASHWERLDRPGYAGISSFGFSGTNAHVIVGTASEQIPVAKGSSNEEEGILFLSAANEESLQVLARKYVSDLERCEASFEDLCATSLFCRARLGKRVAVRAFTVAEATERLMRWLTSKSVPGVMTNIAGDSSGDTLRLPLTDALGKRQWELVFGTTQASVRPNRRVDLPIYPFRWTRFWFGPAADIKLQQQRESAWKAMNAEALRQSLRGPLGWNVESYSSRWQTLEKLSLLHAQHVLAVSQAFDPPNSWSTVEDVVHRCGFRAVYTNLLTRWLRRLAEAGLLQRSGERFRAVGELVAPALEPIWLETERAMADDPAAFEYLARCGAMLAGVLCGRTPALETLFPNGSLQPARRLYEQSVEAQYFNPIVAAAVRAAVEKMQGARPIRVLEIGAGTGATTSAVLNHLSAGRFEYWFTDVSDGFVNRAKEQFKGRTGVHYALFDLDRDPVEQGFPLDAFDVVIAANVVHAVRDLDHALSSIKRLLASGAALVLLETTQHHAWFDMSTGLIEGWQSFDDAYRQDQPLLNPKQWQAVLTVNEFADIAAYPDAASTAAHLGQRVILARTSAAASPAKATVSVSRAGATSGAPPRPTLVRLENIAGPAGEDFSSTEFALCVRQTICSVFRLATPPEELSDRDRLSDLGMDSLIALELRAELSRTLKLADKIPSTIAFETGTVGALVRALETLRRSSDAAHVPTQAHATKAAAMTASRVTAEQLESMTDEQVEQLLAERLGRS